MIRANSTAVATNSYASAALYAPQGGLCALENGGYIISSLVYNNRLQPGRISASSSGTAPSTCPTSISGTGSVLDLSYNFNFGAGDNGNVMGIANNRNTARSETFTYDALNRVSTAWSNGNLWGEAYSIDPWGNLNQFGPYENSQNQILPFVEANQSLTANTQNQVSAFCYDTAGNVLAEAGSQCPPAQGSGFVYNAENQLTFAGGTNYVYDGDGNRVEKYMLNTQGQTVFQELYWYGGGSAPLDETDGTGSTTDSAFNEYVFFDGARTARRNTGGVYSYFADHLGTAREIVQSGSTTPCYDADFTPYGVEMINIDTCSQNYKFTGKERDTESGLDNFGARYDASSMARFMSPDPVLFMPLHIINPQRWNKYAYAVNSPISYVDPDGRDAIAVDFSKEVPVFGHEGIIAVGPDGSATYERFGPSPASMLAAPGVATETPLSTKVTFGKDGLPTPDSYAALAKEVGSLEKPAQDPSTIKMNYFKTSAADTLRLENWMDVEQGLNGPYFFCMAGGNCAGFTVAGLSIGGAIGPTATALLGGLGGGLDPNILFYELELLDDGDYTAPPPPPPPPGEVCAMVGVENEGCTDYN